MLSELEQHLVHSGKYTKEQIGRMLALARQVRMNFTRDPVIRTSS
jgi:hypothetical protein